MESLFEEIQYIANLGHELHIGNMVEWNTCGYTLIGKIISFENGKAVVQTQGCRYSSPEQYELIKAKAKRTYNVKPERLFLLTLKNKKMALS